MNILFLISEVEDIVKTGGLADVGKALPLALKDLGHDVRIFMPYYAQAKRTFKLPDACVNQVLHANEHRYEFGVKELNFENIKVYLIDYPEYFADEDLYSKTSQVSNSEKFAFFSLAALKAAETLAFKPQILHCNDWHTSIACYMAKHDPQIKEFYRDTKSVLSIHNAAFQGVEDLKNMKCVSAHQSHLYVDNGHINLLKTGLIHADKICPVSPSYAQEISTPLGSHGIDDVVRHRQNDVIGVLNGCDYEQWNPETDPVIAARYSVDDISGKAKCKAALQKEFNLPVTKNTPLLGMVCRTTIQKGFGFILPMLEQLLRHKVQIVIVGTGEEDITNPLAEIATKHPKQFAFINDFQSEYAHYVEAGADFFLMPSQFEPCGLNQMYSLAYGTLPIVRAVGGLKDTVKDIDLSDGNGFVFEEPNADALLNVIRKALLLFHEYPSQLTKARKRAMQVKFTWDVAAAKFQSIYKQM
jgi:starch synthase